MDFAKVARILTYVLAGLFFLFGAMKFIMADMSREQFLGWGYPAWMSPTVGVLEVAVGLLLLWPVARFWAAGAGVAILAGAAFTHLKMPEIGLLPLGIPMLIATAWLAWQVRPTWLARPRATAT